MKSKYKKITLSLGLGALLMGSSAFGALAFTPVDVLSSGGSVTGDGAAFKTKLVRMGNGLLVSVFGDSIAGSDAVVYDLKADDVHKVRDIFVRTCMPTDLNGHCASQSEWTEAVNISNTAGLSSALSKWERNADGVLSTTATAYPGDSEKPNIFNAGTFAVVTWTEKYCPGGEQRIVSYLERDGLEIPFSCVYKSHIDFAHPETGWTTTQISSGIRDAKQDVNKGVKADDSKGNWVITWQEDPQGLQIGGGDGPGEGASGASVSHGTDIWYSFTGDLNATNFSEPARLTNNMTHTSSGGNANPLFLNDGITSVTEIESGTAGASRANTAMVNISGSETVPTVLVTYEETKGTGGLDNGKYVRYHNFPFNTPMLVAEGTIISKADENSRRVRFVTQVKASANGMRMGVFWRQGNPVEGGPGDIMVRLGFEDTTNIASTGLRPEDMTAAVNVSSNTVPWSPVGEAVEAPTNTLDDTTDKNNLEDARAHRAVIRGDDFYIGYSYAKDWAVATYTDMDNYNFWMRRYNAPMGTWTVAKNLSNITDVKVHVKEPRLVGMPGNGPGCLTPADPDSVTNPENCQDKSTLLVAWGVESNTYEHIGGSVEGDIYYTRTNDKAETFNGISVVDGIGTSNRFESQLRSTPAGNIVYSVWNEGNNDLGGHYSMLSVSTSDDGTGGSPVIPPVVTPPTDPTDSTVPPVVAPSTPVYITTGGGGCTYNPNSNSFDMTFLFMMALGLLYPFRRKFLK
ncbi:MAG: JDVT-CTERM domain-containing protein [Sulfurovum sp.]|nr:JDVT-CTERM domain-containing protein [Sulfurovum sp.]